MKIYPHRLHGIFESGKKLLTKDLGPRESVYGERLVKGDDGMYRVWDPSRSKLGAALTRGVSQIGIKPGSTVLYLGCSTGTTVSHVSDMVGSEGKIYALDVAPRVLRELMFLAEKRPNIVPILADANNPTTYAQFVEAVDVVFMDIAQSNQVEIFTKNCQAFLSHNGFGLLALKSRSIDISKKPKQIYDEARRQLEKSVKIVDYKTLDPYEADHAFYVCKQ